MHGPCLAAGRAPDLPTSRRRARLTSGEGKEPLTQPEVTPPVRQRRNAVRWGIASIVGVCVPAITVLTMTGHTEQATAIGALGS